MWCVHQRCPCFLSLVHKYGKNSLQPLSFLFFLSTKAFVKARKRQVGLTRRVTPCSGAITNLNARSQKVRDISHVQCFTDFNQKKTSQMVLYISVSILPSHVQSFTNFNQKKKASENKFSFKASLFLSCQNRGISENFILFDVWSFFCIYIVVLVSLYCCFGG